MSIIITRNIKRKALNNSCLISSLDSVTQSQLKDLMSQTDVSDEEDFSISQQSEEVSSEGPTIQQLESSVWVQCDNQACHKWRRLYHQDCGALTKDDDWFCFMNGDSKYNSCDDPEEDTKYYDRLAKKAGLTYVISEMHEGSLVWAKMVGYYRWPAVIIRDPLSGTYVDYDIDNNPSWYHVEFLGNPHSHIWLRSPHVSLYHSGSNKAPFGSDKKKISKKRKRKKIEDKAEQVKIKSFSKNALRLMSAIEEAEILQNVTDLERLSSCIFTRDYLQSQKQKVHIKSNLSQGVLSSQTLESLTEKPPDQQRSEGDYVKCSKINSAQAGTSQLEKACGDHTDMSSSTLNMQFGSSLLNKSKEEKLTIDIKMYQKNEAAFEHDVKRFLARNNLKMKKMPVWQNVAINLFHFFLAIIEKGGYEEVCRKKMWSSVYKELTNTQQNSRGLVAKNWYRKKLYPYELYICGKNYKDVVKSILKKPKPKNTEKVRTQEVYTASPDEETTASSNLEDMLFDLQRYNIMCQFEEDIKASENRLGINITFYDESPHKHFPEMGTAAMTASEFEEACLPASGDPQCVPEALYVNTNSSEDIFQEMQSLQNQIETLDNEIAFI